MKMKKIYILGLAFSCLFSSCVDLDLYPEDTLDDSSYFLKDSDFKLYMNGLYSSITRNLSESIRWDGESGTDNYISEGVSKMVMQHSNSGKASVTNGTWNEMYDNIRKVNYLLSNKDKLTDGSANQYIGEAYYMRACYYFTLLENFGGVPYVDKVLNVDSPELYLERSPREVIAKKILEDLDNAINLLNWKNVGKAEQGRVNKECALLMKTRVALFEGTWEYYHGKKNSMFAVQGKDGKDFLNEVVKAGDELMAKLGNKVFVGSVGNEYSDYFNREDYLNIASAFYYKHYDNSLGISNAWARRTLSGFYAGVTHDLVTCYLMKDGKPEEISTVKYDWKNQASLIENRDPRLYQTVYSPSRGPLKSAYSNLPPNENAFNTVYAPITLSFQPKGGYRIYKGTVLNTISLDVCDCDDLILRYEEVLLNYVEAKAILGSLEQSDIDRTINVLRNKVHMVPMVMSEVESWNVNYSTKEGYDPSASNVLNEIRRERRIELALEGFRTNDLKRWAIWEDVINGYKPLGAYYQEMADYFADEENLKEAGLNKNQFKQVQFVKGGNIDVIGEYINPYWKNPDLSENGRGYYIDPDRDYLKSVPQREIDHYKEKGVELTQNPGWF